jgi:O-antigen/teichoic acid export membrane protein
MIYRATAFLTGSLSIMWYLLLLIFSRAIVDNVAHQPDALGTFRLYTLMIPFLTLNNFFAVAFLVLQRGKLRAKITIFYGALNVLIPIAAVLWQRNVTLVAGGFVAAEVVGAAVFAMSFRRSVAPSLGSRIGPLIQGIKEVFTLGITFFFAQLGWNLIHSVDRIMVKVYLPAAQLGFYSMSALFVTTLGMISSTLGVALVPSLSAAQTAGDTETFRKQVRNTSRAGFLAIVPIILCTYVLAPNLIMLLVPRFGPSISVIRILIFIGALDLTCRISKAALVAHSRGKLLSVSYLIAAAWNIGFNALLIPRMGIEGAAVASLSSFALLASVLAVMMNRVSGATYRLMHLLRPALISLIYVIIGFAMPSEGHLVRILIVAIAGTVLYVILAVLTRCITLNDLATARQALAPRQHIAHVRFVLRLIALAEALARRIGH